MPRLNKRQKQRIRKGPRTWAQSALFAIVNDWEVELPAPSLGTFDARRWPTHAKLREDLGLVATIMHRHRHGVVDGPPRVDLSKLLAAHGGESPRDDEDQAAARGRAFMAIVLEDVVHRWLQGEGAYLCVEQCARATCDRWFFARVDQQTHCDRHARPRRQL